MKYLITGCNGFLAQKIIEILSFSNNEIIATAKDFCKIDLPSNAEFHKLDITSLIDVNRMVDIFPDVIIHTAAISNVDFCETNKDECININCKGAENIAILANQCDAHLVHLSTDFVFDGYYGPYSENDLTSPPNFYGQSKLNSEEIVSDIRPEAAIVRTILVYGETIGTSHSNVVKWVKESLENNKPINVINDQIRMPTLVDDLAKACITIGTDKLSGIYHVSGNELLSIYEIAIRVADLLDLDKSLVSPISSIELNESAKRPHKTGFNISKAYSDFGYIPTDFNKSVMDLYSPTKFL